MKKALDLIPDHLLGRYQPEVRRLFSEIFSLYARTMRQSILEYILRSPEERKRLHIVMLPRSVPTACERQLVRGGFSTVFYAGSHQRKIEAENEVKLRLLTNNVVMSALQGWFSDFRAFNLVELRDLGQFVDAAAACEPGKAQYALDVDAFLSLQDMYRSKVLNVIRHIWYRGCLTIVKKFKLLRLKEDHKRKVGSAKWTFSGYRPRPFESSEG